MAMMFMNVTAARSSTAAHSHGPNRLRRSVSGSASRRRTAHSAAQKARPDQNRPWRTIGFQSPAKPRINRPMETAPRPNPADSSVLSERGSTRRPMAFRTSEPARTRRTQYAAVSSRSLAKPPARTAGELAAREKSPLHPSACRRTPALRNLDQAKRTQAVAAATAARRGTEEERAGTGLADLAALAFPLKAV
ncbi:MAG: hypothetical protein WC728_06440 [Elusimicrobiota bacterium]